MAEQAEDEAGREEDDYGLDPRVVPSVREAIEAGDAGAIDALMEPLHAADIADVLEQIGASDRQALVRLWPQGIDGDVLSELDEAIREDVIEALPHEVLTEAVRELDSDDVVDLIEDLGEPVQERILDALEVGDRVAVEQSLTYPEYSAGRLMQREVVTAPEHWTVGEAIDFLRNAKELPDQFYHVILVDPRWHPVGYVTLGKLLSSKRAVRLTEITEDSFRTIGAMPICITVFGPRCGCHTSGLPSISRYVSAENSSTNSSPARSISGAKYPPVTTDTRCPRRLSACPRPTKGCTSPALPIVASKTCNERFTSMPSPKFRRYSPLIARRTRCA